LGIGIPFVASVGSLLSGYISDTVFKGRRAPVAAGLYFLETIIILSAAQFTSADTAVLFLILSRSQSTRPTQFSGRRPQWTLAEPKWQASLRD
jgi:hypothetical protein